MALRMAFYCEMCCLLSVGLSKRCCSPSLRFVFWPSFLLSIFSFHPFFLSPDFVSGLQDAVSDDSEFELRLERSRSIRHMVENLIATFRQHLQAFRGWMRFFSFSPFLYLLFACPLTGYMNTFEALHHTFDDFDGWTDNAYISSLGQMAQIKTRVVSAFFLIVFIRCFHSLFSFVVRIHSRRICFKPLSIPW